jgi:predicted ATPase
MIDIRVKSITIENIKNVEKGSIEFDMDDKLNNVIGIYGQNGSGKSALVKGLKMIKYVMMGDPLTFQNCRDYITRNKDKSTMSIDFIYQKMNTTYDINYSFSIKKSENSIEVFDEILQYANNQSGNKKTIINTATESPDILFIPIVRYEEIVRKNKNYKVDLIVNKKMALQSQQSFIFKPENEVIFTNGFEEQLLSDIIRDLKTYAKFHFIVLDEVYFNHFNDDKILVHINSENNGKSSLIPFGLFSLKESTFYSFKNGIQSFSSILNTIVPGIHLEIKEHGTSMDSKGNSVINIEVVSVRNGVEIPIKYESTGTQRIISTLGALIQMFNNKNTLLVIDEYDASIFEYLFGELLKVVNKFGKGQLIFTSHNLRPLEVLSYNNIYFTTINPINKYIKFKNIKDSNNLRNTYLRTVDLGGLKETIYDETDEFEIGRAMKMAGEKFNA